MAAPEYDGVVIGGGPAGSAAATVLALARRRVLVLEREPFPRFHIGESLLPYNRAIFDELGLLPALREAGFPRKFGAQFQLGNGRLRTRFAFREGRFTHEPEALQVERSRFDAILLNHARGSGAEVREGWTVQHCRPEDQSVRIEARDPQGAPQPLRTRFVVDASGSMNLTGNQEGLRQVHPHLRKVALFGHFEGVRRETGEAGGDTVLVRLANKWFWFIPISDTKTSVGLVMDRDEFSRAGLGPSETFNSWRRCSPAVLDRMLEAVPVGRFHVAGDFSYRNRRLVSGRVVRAGDAAGFIDPVFSSGVYLAMRSGKLAGELVAGALSSGDVRLPSRAYERLVRGPLDFYRWMVEGFYRNSFMELLLQPRPGLGLPDAVNAALAGRVEIGWDLAWRLRVFRCLAALQARRPLVPRLSFGDVARDEVPKRATQAAA